MRLSVGAATLALVGSTVGSRVARAAGSQPQLHRPSPTAHDADNDGKNVGVAPAPFPTRGPDLGEMEMDLRKRALFIGTDTCGFISGIFKQSYVCNLSTRSCTTVGSFVACCPTDGSSCHDFPTTCVPFPATSCLNTDQQSVCCTNSASPACYTAILSGATGLACYPYSTEVTMFGLPTDVNVDPSSTSTATTSSPSTSGQSSSSGSATTSSTGPATTTAESSGSSAPVGAIVGGVVGGLAVIGAVIIAAIFILKRKRSPTPPPGHDPNAPLQGGPPGPPSDQQTFATVSPASGYAAMYPQQQGQGQYAPQMTEQGQYAPHMSQQSHLYPQQMQPSEYSPSASSPQPSQYGYHPTGGTVYKPYPNDQMHQPPTQAYELDPNQQQHELP